MDKREIKTYDMSTPKGAINAISQTMIVGGTFFYSLWAADNYSGEGWALVLMAVSGLAIIAYIVPAWFDWIATMLDEHDRERRAIAAISPRTIAAEYEIKLEQERQKTIQYLRHLSDKQIDYAETIAITPTIDIEGGARITWTPDGRVQIPVWFAALWWQKYLAREGDQLPAQHDYDAEVGRDVLRQYNKAVEDALKRRGVIRGASGPISARWIVKTEAAKQRALWEIGFYTALAIAETLEQETSEQE